MNARRRWLKAGSAACLFWSFARHSWAKRAQESRTSSALRSFSEYSPGPVPEQGPGWYQQRLNGIAPNQCDWVRDGPQTLLRLRSELSASGLAHDVSGAWRASNRLDWRWRVDGFPAQSRLGEKSADDFAARVYVLFDYPLEKMPFGQRMALRVARALAGNAIPGAALVYLRHASAPAQTLVHSPYTDRARMIVVRSDSRTGQWFEESRNLQADFQRAFGAEYGPGMAPVTGILLGADTDQTGGRVQTWYSAPRLWMES